MKTLQTPKIYVGTYRKYNEGSLFGKWLDLTDYTSYEEFYQYCKELHIDEEDPELMFQDWEYIPDKFIGESYLSKQIYGYIEAIDDMEDNEIEAFTYYLEDLGSQKGELNFDEILGNFQSEYQGYFEGKVQDSKTEFAYFYIENNGIINEIPEHLQQYFDYEKYAQDLFLTDYVELNGHVFIK